jgi:hypothetical protein
MGRSRALSEAGAMISTAMSLSDEQLLDFNPDRLASFDYDAAWESSSGTVMSFARSLLLPGVLLGTAAVAWLADAWVRSGQRTTGKVGTKRCGM